MINKISHITVLVKDQDEALKYYTEKLGFEKIDDEKIGDFRWLVVAPRTQKETGIILMKAETQEEKLLTGRQTGGRHSLFVLSTENFQKTYAEMKAKGVLFKNEPMKNPWGMAVQFMDLYGNQFDLYESRK